MAKYTTVEDSKDSDTIWHQISGYKPLPIQAFKIKVDSDKDHVYSPGDTVKGRILLKNNEAVACLGIVVCLEGFATVNYTSGGVLRKKAEKLLSPSTNRWTTVFLVGSPEDYNNWIYCLKTNSDSGSVSTKYNGRYHKIEAGEQIIPFEISTAKLNPWPGTYMGSSGEINYRVIACVIIKIRIRRQVGTKKLNYKFVEQNIQFSSYLNLETLLLAQNPVSVEGNNSFLSWKKIKSVIHLNRTGFIPGESIPFTLNVTNPHGKLISKLSVALIYKTSYLSDVSSRVKSNALQVVENNEIKFESDGEMEWADAIEIPSNLYPSVAGQLIQHQYSVKVEIYSADKKSPVVQSLIPITIGTVREDQSLSIENKPLPRSLSMLSLTSIESLPPSYSDLFSNTTSPSTESLPPLYEDVA